MSRVRFYTTLLIAMIAAVGSASASRFHRSPTSGHLRSGKHSRHISLKLRGQQSIDSERARQIQTALIREHYMNGEVTGQWDERSKDAMTRFQADNGWQTKLTPDSRALIKLGLGPDHSSDLAPGSSAQVSNSFGSSTAASQ